MYNSFFSKPNLEPSSHQLNYLQTEAYYFQPPLQSLKAGLYKLQWALYYLISFVM